MNKFASRLLASLGAVFCGIPSIGLSQSRDYDDSMMPPRALPRMPDSDDNSIGEVVNIPSRFDAERLQEAQDRRERKAAKREEQMRRVKGSPFSL